MDHMPFAAGDQLQLEPDYADVYQAWKKNPVPETRHAMLKAIDPIIQSGIQAYGGPSSGSPTLYSQARRLALQSFDSYDPAKGGLRSHVLNNLRRLQRLGAQQAQIISLPERVAMDRRHLEETEGMQPGAWTGRPATGPDRRRRGTRLPTGKRRLRARRPSHPGSRRGRSRRPDLPRLR